MSYTFNYIFDELQKLNKIEKKNLIEKVVKLSEETGELSAEILKLHGLKGSKGKTKTEVEEEALYECADILMMLVCICDDLGFNSLDLIAGCNEKIKKYNKNLQKQNTWGFEDESK